MAGAKGTVDQLVIALGSAGVFTATVECLRAWLARDKNRRIDLRWTQGGQERSVTLSGEAVDTETMRDLARVAAAQAGGASWPAGTVPS